MRLLSILTSTVMMGLFLPAVLAADFTPKPNIIIILADDLGYTDLGCMGSRYYETPNIDRLAREGIKFSSYYSGQNCTPSRACLMSGQYGPRTEMYTVGELTRGKDSDRRMVPPPNNTELPLDRVTLADALKKAGYATAIFGKWHIGEHGPYHPSQRGFDEAITSMGRHYDYRTQPQVDVPDGTYLADFLTDKAVGFIEKNKDRPFFLYLSHFAVHTPLQAKPEWIGKFKSKSTVGGHKNPVYAAMIASLDESVGRVMARLDELKLTDSTAVFFLSDNGGVGGYQAAGINAVDNTDNSPLRAGKGTLYEGGIRVPFLAHYPRFTKAGGVCDESVIHVDMFPTCLELAGATKPSQPLDGISLVPLLKDPATRLGREAIYWHFPGYLEAKSGWRTTPVGVIRAGDFKLMEFFETGQLELYNLKIDLGEKHNLADSDPEKTRELHARLAKWRQDLNAKMPTARK